MSSFDSKDYLTEDVGAEGWACVSLISPEYVKNCKHPLINIRGGNYTREEAREMANFLVEEDPRFMTFTCEMGKWICYPFVESSPQQLNFVMQKYLQDRQQRKHQEEDRKELLMNNKSSKFDEHIEELKQDKLEVVDKTVQVDKSKVVKKLPRDEINDLQRYVGITFLSSKGILDEYDVIGFKIRFICEDDKDVLNEKGKEFQEMDPDFHTFIYDVGRYYIMAPDPDSNEDAESVYHEKELNELVQSRKREKKHISKLESIQKSEEFKSSLSKQFKDVDETSRANQLRKIQERHESKEDINRGMKSKVRMNRARNNKHKRKVEIKNRTLQKMYAESETKEPEQLSDRVQQMKEKFEKAQEEEDEEELKDIFN